MKNYNNNSGHIPFRENFSDGFQALPPRKALSSQVKSLIWLTLEMFPWALLCLGSVCKFLKVPGKNNVFFDIHKKKVDKLKAPLFLGKNNYFKFDGRQYRAITIADETRPAITGSSVQGKGTITGDSRIRLGLGLNERIAPKLFNCECKVSVTLKGEGKVSKNSFSFPVNGENSLFSHKLGESWIDWYMDAPFSKPCEAELILEAELFKSGKRVGSDYFSAITWAAPQIISLNKNTKTCTKVIYISIEGLTDPIYLQKKYNLNFTIPNYMNLMSSSTVYTNAYSQADATLTAAGCYFTGLLPLQHGIFDYKVKPWDLRIKNISPQITTISEMLKSQGFFTQAYAFQPRFTPRYGWYRGFDNYKYSMYSFKAASFPSRFAINFLDESISQKAFLFMHWDGLHDNYWISQPSGKMILKNNYNADYPISKDSLYAERLRYIDTELGILINYLKSSNQWDESLVILTSDHGYWGALWKKHRDFALYEDRVRVPLMIKWPKSKGVPAGEVSTPTNATVGSLLDMLDAIDVSLPAYQKMLPQFDSKIKDMAICETVMQPERDDYALALVSDKYKYFFRCKINWDNFSMQKFLYHKLFMKIDGDFDETQDFSTIHNQEAEKFKNLAMEIVSANLDFLSKHQPINLKDLK